MTAADFMWIGAGLTLLVGLVAVVCEAILFFDPEVKRRFALGPYLVFARHPLPANRVGVWRLGVVAGVVALLLTITLLLLDEFSDGRLVEVVRQHVSGTSSSSTP